jgi:hypothetical protein
VIRARLRLRARGPFDLRRSQALIVRHEPARAAPCAITRGTVLSDGEGVEVGDGRQALGGKTPRGPRRD